MTHPVIELRGLARTYLSGDVEVSALRPTDLVIGAGESVAVMGRSGSGKSTLLNLLGLLDRPSSGHYLLDGVDTAGLSDAGRTRVRGRRIGFVFQSFHLLPYRTSVENVQLALLYTGAARRDRRARAEAALERVGLRHRRDFLPRTLSGGERQRVAIARAVVAEPAMLLADEPTGNLDTATAAEVLAVFDALHREGMTVVTVTHDEAVAARFDRRLRMQDGVLTDETATAIDWSGGRADA